MEKFFYYIALVPVLGILAQWIAWRIRLPSILLLLMFGVALGQFYNPDHLLAELAYQSAAGIDRGETTATEIHKAYSGLGPRILFPIVSLCVGVIMFEGGLSLRFSELKKSGGAVFRLVTFGALISLILTGLASHFLLGLNWRIAALLGGVLVVTGPTVVVPLLRHIRPNKKIGAIVKWEGIVIDPIGAILAVLIFDRLIKHANEEYLTLMTLVIILKTAVLGLALGWMAGKILVAMVRRFLVPDYLHGVFFLTVTLAVFSISNIVQEESGLVTVTILGIYLANQKSISIEHVVHFKENLGVLLISCLFIVLGSRLDLAGLMGVGWRGVAFLAILILLVRPISVFVSNIGAGLNLREKTFLAFLAPRGIVAAAVASVFSLHIKMHATHQEGDVTWLQEMATDADKLVPLTFLVIVGTVAVYGLCAAPLARLLKLDDANPQGILFAGAERWIRQIAEAVQNAGFTVVLVDTNYGHVSKARQKHLNAYCFSILAEDIEENIEMAGVGRLIALTSSDEVNAMANQEFKNKIGRQNVYQLTPEDANAGPRTKLGEHLRGLIFVDEELTRDRLVSCFRRGWNIKTTKLSPEFTYDDFRAMYGEEALVMFVVESEGKSLRVMTDGESPEGSDGESLIALIDPTQIKAIDEIRENSENKPGN